MTTVMNAQLEKLLNKCDIGTAVLLHMVPTRIIRILQVGNDGKLWRVEQLVEHGGFGGPEPKGEWRTLTTHSSQDPGAAISAAFQAALKAQQDLIYKLRSRMEGRIQKLGAV